ncbi:MAG: ABC transporter permease, partial [Anaerolineae bacterium]
LQSLTGMEGTVNDIAIRAEPEASQSEMVRAVRGRLEPYGIIATTLQEDQPSNAALQLDLEGYRELAFLMPTIILFVAAASVYVMLGRLVHAQRPQIGVLKAVGYSGRTVLLHYLAFALIIAVLGSALGLMLGLPLVRGTTQIYAAELGIPLVQTRFYADLALVAPVLFLVLAIAAGLGPALASARAAPAQAMRLDPAAALVGGSISLPERVIQLPLWIRLPLRNVFRVRRRSFTTLSGVIFAFVLVLMSWGMFDSMDDFLDQSFRVVRKWDALAIFDGPRSTDLLEEVSGWEGVRDAQPIVVVPATIRVGKQEKDVRLTALDPSQELHALQLPANVQPEDALAPGRVVLTPALAEALEVGRGEALQLSSVLGRAEFELGATSDEPAGTNAYISLEDAQALAGAPEPFLNGLLLAIDTSRAGSIKADLYQIPGVTQVELKADTEGEWRALMGLFYAFMGVVLAFALAMSFALLFNTMTVNVLERQREFATMRAFGTSGRLIALHLTTENLLIWAIALIPGLWLGRTVAVQMAEAFNSELFSFRMVISPGSYLLASLGILITMLLAAVPAIRRVNRLNLAEATKILT